MANDTLEGTGRRTPLLDAIEGTLADFLGAQIVALDGTDPALGGLARTTRDLVLAGGKRLRPTFAYWGWRAVSDDPVEPVLPALAALELMHTFALVHDDVMDESATRRGRPTAHRIFARQHGARFGESAAILVGDLCLVWADQLLARTPMPAATLFAVRNRYDRMRVEAVAGQYLDVLGERDPGQWSVERALLVARLKTASYSVQRPLQFGLALAGPASQPGSSAASPALSSAASLALSSAASPALSSAASPALSSAASPALSSAASPALSSAASPALSSAASPALDDVFERYGALVGEAFQLRDDLLGVFGDPAVTGKPAGDDLRSGKPTVLRLLARGAADAEAIAATGAPEVVEAMIRERVASAVAVLADAPIADEARAALVELAVRATERPA